MSLEHILLGLLEEPATGYDLKNKFERSTRFFWGAELSQIYNTLQRLERNRLLTSRRTPSVRGPQRRVYSLTPLGRKQLQNWLAQSPQFGQERFSYLAQLFFMSASENLSRTHSFVSELRTIFHQRLEALRQIEAEWPGHRSAHSQMAEAEFHQFLSLRAGIWTMEARLRWCDESMTSIRERMRLGSSRRKATRKRAKK